MDRSRGSSREHCTSRSKQIAHFLQKNCFHKGRRRAAHPEASILTVYIKHYDIIEMSTYREETDTRQKMSFYIQGGEMKERKAEQISEGQILDGQTLQTILYRKREFQKKYISKYFLKNYY